MVINSGLHKERKTRDFPGDPAAKTLLSMQGAWV